MATGDPKMMVEELEREYAGVRTKAHDLREYLCRVPPARAARRSREKSLRPKFLVQSGTVIAADARTQAKRSRSGQRDRSLAPRAGHRSVLRTCARGRERRSGSAPRDRQSA